MIQIIFGIQIIQIFYEKLLFSLIITFQCNKHYVCIQDWSGSSSTTLTHFCPPLRFRNQFLPTVPTFAVRESTIVSEGFKGGTRGSPIMPRDVSLSDSKCWNGGQKLVAKTQRWPKMHKTNLWNTVHALVAVVAGVAAVAVAVVRHGVAVVAVAAVAAVAAFTVLVRVVDLHIHGDVLHDWYLQ